MTPSEYAKNAVAALQQVLHISPSDFDASGATTVIEQAIRNAAGERDIQVHRELSDVHTAAQERLARLLSASPAVIYSFEGTGKYVPVFVSDNITDIFGYAPAEYLKDPTFWRDRVHPDDLSPRRGGHHQILPEWDPRGGVSLSPQRWLVLLGERRAASDPGRRRQTIGDRWVVE